MGVGLGGSIAGFFLGSGQKFMELSKIMTHLQRRFRELEEDTTSWGTSLGFTRAQAAGLLETIGKGTNVPTKGFVTDIMGFSLERGVDPGATAGIFSRLARITGKDRISSGMMASFAGRADMLGMGQGRFEEYMQGIGGFAEQQFSATGTGNLGALVAMSAMPGLIFGAQDPRSQGQAGVGFMGRLQGVMTGGTMKTYMMRAMGYGRKGGPGYIEMRKRLEAGIWDKENLTDLFGGFQKRGLGRGGMFRALEVAGGGQLKAHEIEALVDTLGTREGLEGARSLFEGGTKEGKEAFLSGLTEKERSVFEKAGVTGLGGMPGRVAGGAAAAVQFEGMQMAIGAPIAQGIIDMRSMLTSLAGTFTNILGVDFGATLTTLTGAMVSLAEASEVSTSGLRGLKADVETIREAGPVLTGQAAGEEAAALLRKTISRGPEGLFEDFGAPFGLGSGQ